VNPIKWLVEQFGSKKLIAALCAVAAALVVPDINRSLGVSLDSGAVATQLAVVVGPLVLYILAQWHIDVTTGGKTTTAYQLTQTAATAAAAALPANTIAAQVASAVVAALRDPEAGPLAPPAVPPAAPPTKP